MEYLRAYTILTGAGDGDDVDGLLGRICEQAPPPVFLEARTPLAGAAVADARAVPLLQL